MGLSIAHVLDIQDRQVVNVPCPAWGGDVYIRTLTGAERDAFDNWASDAVKAGRPVTDLRARIVAMSWCDESGTPEVVTDEVVSLLSQKDGGTLDMIFDECNRISRLGFGKGGGDEKNSSGKSTGSG